MLPNAHHPTLLRRALLPLTLALAATPAPAQKVGRQYFEDPHYGYRFRYPDDWQILPVKPDKAEHGMTGNLSGDPLSTKASDANVVLQLRPELWVLRLEPEPDEPVIGQESTGLRGRVEEGSAGRPDLGEALDGLMDALRDFDPALPAEDEEKEIDDLEARHRTWRAFNGMFDLVIDTWTFPLSDADVSLVFVLPEQHHRKWRRTLDRCAKSFERIERVAAVERAKPTDYAGLLAYHRDQAARAEGWRVLPTPSERFVIKTSSDDDDFVEEVIERLENSRDLFERDWPLPEDFHDVSVVRICKDADEFQRYGSTHPGVAGWFSPSTTELVLFDTKNVDRRMTFAVMTHEAFHQYCYFLFDQAEAHRWFDEGHGDYYGAAEFGRRGVEIETRMPGGLDRRGTARSIVQSGDFEPLEKHLNFSHPEWQMRGLASYAQSWSIVYMLRRGMLGELHRRYWEPEYADILPNYVAALHAGFQRAFVEELEKRIEDAEEDGRELTPEEREIDRFDIDEEVKQEIWKEAMDASWGKIDLAEFEERWVEFVEEEI